MYMSLNPLEPSPEHSGVLTHKYYLSVNVVERLRRELSIDSLCAWRRWGNNIFKT